MRAVARKLYDDRRQRDRMFSEHLFGEPAWDMLLALYSEEGREEALDVTWLARTARVPKSTAVRWQWVLVEEGLIDLGPLKSVVSGREVRFTAKGRKLMERCLFQSCDMGGPPPDGQGDS